MKKSIGVLLVGSLLLTRIGHVKADWIKDQQGKWEYFSNEDGISHLYDEKPKDFVKPVKLPQYYQADARWSSKRYGIFRFFIVKMTYTVFIREIFPFTLLIFYPISLNMSGPKK